MNNLNKREINIGRMSKKMKIITSFDIKRYTVVFDSSLTVGEGFVSLTSP